MARFLFVYHGGSMPETPEDQAAVMAAWGAWLGAMGAAAKDPGAPVGMSSTVTADGVRGDGGANPASGYSIIEAADLDAALAHAKGCPILNNGGEVEVAEIHEISL